MKQYRVTTEIVMFKNELAVQAMQRHISGSLVSCGMPVLVAEQTVKEMFTEHTVRFQVSNTHSKELFFKTALGYEFMEKAVRNEATEDLFEDVLDAGCVSVKEGWEDVVED